MLNRRIAVIILSLTITACATVPPQPPAGASPQATNGTTWVDRSAEYQAIVLQTYRAAFADFGVRFFVLPNPMYGSWQR